MVSKRATDFWRKLAQWYGSRLADQYGPKCPDEWAAVIDRIDDDRIQVALARIKKDHVKFPPTLGELEAAIPEKHFVNAGPSMAYRLAEFAMANRRLCDHQKARPWTYGGPVDDFVSKHRNNLVIRHPRISYVFIAACDKCDREAVKVREDHLTEAA